MLNDNGEANDTTLEKEGAGEDCTSALRLVRSDAWSLTSGNCVIKQCLCRQRVWLKHAFTNDMLFTTTLLDKYLHESVTTTLRRLQAPTKEASLCSSFTDVVVARTCYGSTSSVYRVRKKHASCHSFMDSAHTPEWREMTAGWLVYSRLFLQQTPAESRTSIYQTTTQCKKWIKS